MRTSPEQLLLAIRQGQQILQEARAARRRLALLLKQRRTPLRVGRTVYEIHEYQVGAYSVRAHTRTRIRATLVR